MRLDRMRAALLPRPSVLRRRSDGIETAALRCAVVLLVLLVPFLVLLGRHGADDAAADAAATRAQAHPVTATVLEAPPGAGMTAGYTGGLSTVDVAWVEPDLTRHTTQITAAPSVRTGDRMQLWIAAGDRPVVPPASDTDAVVEGVVDAVGALVAAVVVLAGLLITLRLVLDRARMRAWDADWWTFVHRRDRGTTG
ncbi:Rv1733c family protein [Actinomycetospora termitidis]|uniref:Transmembrane protein n=1 Tax=Actinomycetospora termitidis TaxID=3053470 RepID=A0ABT7MFZ8_9PSEU|nr:hypothetical protein [Actinomycetospora sp. Odt1-22]MDL5159594.1 hypothetical protein [Actinomycetospora sp. Odt1-22]